jgi:hypothetical protein
VNTIASGPETNLTLLLQCAAVWWRAPEPEPSPKQSTVSSKKTWPVSQRAKLYLLGYCPLNATKRLAVAALNLAFGGVVISVSSCADERAAARKRITPVYDQQGKLQLLKYDSKGNGKVDTWSYMDGARVVRIEIDKDGDGKIDRWEYYDADQKIEKVGLSRLNDGKADAWSFAGSDGKIARVEVSTHRDDRIDRIEYFEHEVMVRAEEDGDGDGRPDKWETYDGGRLTSVAFDTTHRGVADRRLTYGPGGAARMEVDPKGDGRFVPLAADASTSPPANAR